MINQIAFLFFLRYMRKNQWKSRAEIEEIQLSKLKMLHTMARDAVPFYKDQPDIKDLDDLKTLPILSKKIVQENAQKLISRKYDQNSLTTYRTSGSTGMPLELYRGDPQEELYRRDLHSFRLTEAGVGPLNHVGFVTHDMSTDSFDPFGPFYRSTNISLKDGEEKILSKLRIIKPDILRSYPSMLVLLAHHNLRSDNKFKAKRVLSGAEVLTEKTRELIKTSFGCEVRNMFGAIEAGSLAVECDHGSMHLHSDSVIAEIVDSSGNVLPEGKEGQLVVTPLWQKVMPLIRYRLGDITSMQKKCSCGRGSHVLGPINGRSDDLLALPSGKPFFPRLPKMFIIGLPGIKLYQLVQERAGELTVFIVPAADFKKSTTEKAKRILPGLFPEPMDIEIELVDSLPLSKAGKLRAVFSKVKPEF